MRRLQVFGFNISKNAWCFAYVSFISAFLYLVVVEFRIFNEYKRKDKKYIRNDHFNYPHELDIKQSEMRLVLKKEMTLLMLTTKKIELKFISDTFAFKRYTKPRDIKVNPNNFNFLIPGKTICKQDPYLLVVCMSEHSHTEERLAIRQTWGNWSQHKTTDGYKLPRFRIVFMFGSSPNSSTDMNIVKEESRKYGDVIMADFEESYFNLTQKVLTSLKWSIKYCKKIKFILKVDEDTFIHIPNLLRFLETVHVPTKGLIIGHAEFKHKVLRSGRWPLSESIYPFRDYPPYVSGNSYVISGNTIENLLTTSEFLPYIYIEDVFITGILREAIGAGLRHRAGFTWWTERYPRLCSFHNKHRISATNTNQNRTRLLWKALQDNLTNCYDASSLQKLEFFDEKKNFHILLENH